MITLMSLLKEVGEASATPYKVELDFYEPAVGPELGEARYTFKTDSGLEYEVKLLEINKGTRLLVAFKLDDGYYEDETNQGEQYKIMATVVNIVKQHLMKATKIKEITFSPSKANSTDQRRSQFYKAYIDKQLPGSKVHTMSDGRFIIELPKKKSSTN